MRRCRRLPARAGSLLALPAALLALGIPSEAAARAGDGPKLVVDTAVTNASWRQGWLEPGAAVSFTGKVDGASTLTAVLRPVARAGIVTARVDFQVAGAGAFKERLRLPPRALPGQYTLKISGASGAVDLTPVARTVTIAAPPEGVVDRVQVGTTPSGPWQLYQGSSAPVVHGAYKQLWMRFRFLYPPTGKDIELIWKLHWHTVIGKVSKRYKDTLTTYCKSGSVLPSGRWVVQLKIDGRVAKQMDVVIT